MRLFALLLLSLSALFGQDPLSRGEELYRQTDYRASLAVVAQIAQPGGEAYGLAGRDYFMLGEYKKATEAFQRAFALDPRNSEYAHWLGRSFGRRAETSGPFMAPMHASRARGYFEQAGVASRINVSTGDALELLSEHKQEFDIIFNDVDKEDYPRVLRLALPRLRKGGLFVTDNVLWSGRVAQKNPDKTTKAILELNRLLYSSPDMFTTILPIRDGVAVAVKK